MLSNDDSVGFRPAVQLELKIFGQGCLSRSCEVFVSCFSDWSEIMPETRNDMEITLLSRVHDGKNTPLSAIFLVLRWWLPQGANYFTVNTRSAGGGLQTAVVVFQTHARSDPAMVSGRTLVASLACGRTLTCTVSLRGPCSAFTHQSLRRPGLTLVASGKLNRSRVGRVSGFIENFARASSA